MSCLFLLPVIDMTSYVWTSFNPYEVHFRYKLDLHTMAGNSHTNLLTTSLVKHDLVQHQTQPTINNLSFFALSKNKMPLQYHDERTIRPFVLSRFYVMVASSFFIHFWRGQRCLFIIVRHKCNWIPLNHETYDRRLVLVD